MTAPRPEPGRCRRCPVAPGSPCAGTDVPRLCELIDPDHPDHDPSYRAVLADPPPRPSDSDRVRERRRGLGETLSLLTAMKACPHRVERTDCGCGGLAFCKSGKGRGGVVHSGDCFACLEAERPRPTPPPRP